MKKLKFPILMLAMLMSLAACNNDDEVAPVNDDDILDAKLSLFEMELQVETPEAMHDSEDWHAAMAVGYVESINSFSAFGAFFSPPEGAKKSTGPIDAANARLAASFTVYEWSYEGASIAYQFSEQSGKNVFEIFFKDQGQKDYMRFYYAEETKDGKIGTFKVYDIEGEDPSSPAMIWTWEILANESLKFIFSTPEDGFRYEVISNKDKSGSVKQYNEGVLDIEMQWDTFGNGNWKSYLDGELSEEGEWTV